MKEDTYTGVDIPMDAADYFEKCAAILKAIDTTALNDADKTTLLLAAEDYLAALGRAIGITAT